MALSAPILQAVEEIGYETPSAIQAQAIPVLLEGRDLLGQAQTGTGKTAAFALPLLSHIDLEQAHPQLLVLTPTRELAIQVAEAMQTYARHLNGFHVLPVYGGQGMSHQLRQLKRGVHAIVGTPGRIQDHLDRGTLKLDGLRAVVLDEADEMLRMGFIDDVEAILQHAPAKRQVALFSATMPKQIAGVAHRHLRDPVEIKIATKTTTVSTITQRYWQVRGVHKLDALTRMLEVEDFDAIIVFVRTKTATMDLAEKLEARGYAVSALNGDMNQAQREQAVERLRNGGLDIVVATDVAARGLDVERITHVINYDIPTDTEAYVHRIGRTGRAGRAGQAILFVSPRERRLLYAIEKATRQPIAEMTLPSHAELHDKRVGRFKESVLAAIESEELEGFEEIVAELQAETDIGLSEIAAALAFLAQKDRPLKGFETPAGADAAETAARPERERSSGGDKSRGSFDREVEPGMARFRIDVGRSDGVKPGNIVGAIANEADIPAKQIGHIKIMDTYSYVDLPEDLDASLIDHLRTVWICGAEMNLRAADSVNEAEEARKPRPKRAKRPRKGDAPGAAAPGPNNAARSKGAPKANRQGDNPRRQRGTPSRDGNRAGAARDDDNFGNSWDHTPSYNGLSGFGDPNGPGRGRGASRNGGGGSGRQQSRAQRMQEKSNAWLNQPTAFVSGEGGSYGQRDTGFVPVTETTKFATKGKRIDPDAPPAPRKPRKERTPGKLSVNKRAGKDG